MLAYQLIFEQKKLYSEKNSILNVTHTLHVFLLLSAKLLAIPNKNVMILLVKPMKREEKSSVFVSLVSRLAHSRFSYFSVPVPNVDDIAGWWSAVCVCLVCCLAHETIACTHSRLLVHIQNIYMYGIYFSLTCTHRIGCVLCFLFRFVLMIWFGRSVGRSVGSLMFQNVFGHISNAFVSDSLLSFP